MRANLSKRRPPAARGAHAPRRERPEAPPPSRQRGPARRRVGSRLSLVRQAGPHAGVEVGGPLRGVDGGRAGEELEEDDAEGEDVRGGRVLACRGFASERPGPRCMPELQGVQSALRVQSRLGTASGPPRQAGRGQGVAPGERLASRADAEGMQGAEPGRAVEPPAVQPLHRARAARTRVGRARSVLGLA